MSQAKWKWFSITFEKLCSMIQILFFIYYIEENILIIQWDIKKKHLEWYRWPIPPSSPSFSTRSLTYWEPATVLGKKSWMVGQKGILLVGIVMWTTVTMDQSVKLFTLQTLDSGLKLEYTYMTWHSTLLQIKCRVRHWNTPKSQDKELTLYTTTNV